jgi:Rieske Fe-S protein
MDRRTVLKALAAMAKTAVAAFLSLPAILYILSPLRRRSAEAGWIDLGSLEALPQGAPALVRYEIVVTDGWSKKARPASAWVYRSADQVRVFTSTCPHLGCTVRWRPEASRFSCPCHESTFSVDGARISGPAPRTLDPLPWKLEDGRLYAQHVVFRPGVPRRESA